jgi:hypothetical protein
VKSLIVLLVSAGILGWWFTVGSPDYPEEWPKPDTGMLANKMGNCPDLRGDYDGVNGELTWLLGQNPDYESHPPVWQEHRAVVTQADDGAWLHIALSLNEKGLAGFRERMLRFNTESNGADIHRDLWLEHGRDYTCRGGWLFSQYFPQSDFVHGMRRVSLQLARDDSGALIAGATLGIESPIFSWADVSSDTTIVLDETRWHRWPARNPANDAVLANAQDVTLHRYGWINHGNRIPFRFTSFYLEPICVRFVWEGYPVKVSGPVMRRSRDDPRPEEQQCPASWGRFDVGEVFRRDLTIPYDGMQASSIEWYRLNDTEKKITVIPIPDVRELPLMPGEKTGIISR